MFCTHCGSQIPDNARFCPACGLQQGVPPTQTPPPYAAAQPPIAIKSYLAEAILITICCCLPFGIVSIVYASQVNSKLAIGDYRGAFDASEKARLWTLWGFILGILSTFGSISANLLLPLLYA